MRNNLVIDNVNIHTQYHVYIAEDGLAIGEAEPKRYTKDDIPGMNGSLDYSSFWGEITYEEREIEVLLQGKYSEFHPLRQTFENAYNGLNSSNIVFTEDTDKYWKGFIKIKEIEENGHYSTIKLIISAKPFPFDSTTDEEIK